MLLNSAIAVKYIKIFIYVKKLKDFFMKPVHITKLTAMDLPPFVSFVKQLKRSADDLLGIGKIKNPLSWGITGININERRSGAFLIAKHKEKIIGFCFLFQKDGRYEIGIAVLPAYRGRGIGSRMLSAAIAEARALGLREVYAGVKKKNALARKFFATAGFKIHEKRKNSFLLVKRI
jgi:ribosomal protein S18 acetylase RimI-like enzyme